MKTQLQLLDWISWNVANMAVLGEKSETAHHFCHRPRAHGISINDPPPRHRRQHSITKHNPNPRASSVSRRTISHKTTSRTTHPHLPTTNPAHHTLPYKKEYPAFHPIPSQIAQSSVCARARDN
ncbi:hypothetical protein L873DRAFT_1244308 [Choiromyces venosus 120613-1]|uniref:Uncharacterized protein n=1 Tax=Choiromyces venosus 120613-1 TaxID=1336337 RepID=A0A3N4JDE0_9PEZI|nr:hypothetical protein L873DRAFT_1244308 [Choiromyces venosus 120613-1]